MSTILRRTDARAKDPFQVRAPTHAPRLRSRSSRGMWPRHLAEPSPSGRVCGCALPRVAEAAAARMLPLCADVPGAHRQIILGDHDRTLVSRTCAWLCMYPASSRPCGTMIQARGAVRHTKSIVP